MHQFPHLQTAETDAMYSAVQCCAVCLGTAEIGLKETMTAEVEFPLAKNRVSQVLSRVEMNH